MLVVLFSLLVQKAAVTGAEPCGGVVIWPRPIANFGPTATLRTAPGSTHSDEKPTTLPKVPEHPMGNRTRSLR